jgi:F420-dependent methylenetetrahydromethanopterin dehydrogenase
MQHDAKLVVVQSCGSRVEAELVKGALENADIPAMIQSDTAGKMRDHLAWTGMGFRILVREEDATPARDVLTTKADDPDGDSESDRDP